MNLIQRKILYLNIMFLFVFLIGITFMCLDMCFLQREDAFTKSAGSGMIAFSLGSWGLETKAYIKIGHSKEK